MSSELISQVLDVFEDELKRLSSERSRKLFSWVMIWGSIIALLAVLHAETIWPPAKLLGTGFIGYLFTFYPIISACVMQAGLACYDLYKSHMFKAVVVDGASWEIIPRVIVTRGPGFMLAYVIASCVRCAHFFCVSYVIRTCMDWMQLGFSNPAVRSLGMTVMAGYLGIRLETIALYATGFAERIGLL